MDEYLMTSPTYGPVTMSDVARIVADYMEKDRDAAYEIDIGTDSQTHYEVKMVEVVAVRRVGKGGIYFYHKDFIPKFWSLKEKILSETGKSIALANTFYDALETELLERDKVMEDFTVCNRIHCDIGNVGPTNALIPEIVGWVKSSGYECCIKPDSYAASSVANKISK